jgi:hypothetical protein
MSVTISGPAVPAQDQFFLCLAALRPLLVQYNNEYCNEVYHGQCSMNGAYQPSVMPPAKFVGTVTIFIYDSDVVLWS